ncbi:hypothetical protein EDD18DRAFT_1455799 [Armillaria luteobubalina]|uniref:Uncharacterized protein n=1 Tax=Armillaria luteobubalina TaxID=153913 RepID=A0AA39V0V5_9AGAR|nr:hypothetical protein EDD18DRAFT_1455799 [Armillaria luteobubalina]
MAVKDLVHRFESSLSASSPVPGPSRSQSTPQSLTRIKVEKDDGTATKIPPPPHPLMMKTVTTPHDDDSRMLTIDIADLGRSNKDSDTHAHQSRNTPSSAPKHKSDQYLPMDFDSDTLVSAPTSEEKSFLIQRHNAKQITVPHTPVAATDLFARKAAPLHLPKLDKYLSALQPPDFLRDDSKWDKNSMFPPMDRLVLTGRPLDDLETNSKVPASWRDRKTVLGSAVGIVLGVTGSSALATYYSLQGLTNTVQIFALILNSIVPVNGSEVWSEWRQLFLGTIPNIIALNFASTLIQSLVYLIVFFAISSGLLYYFFRSALSCDRYTCIEGLQQTVQEGKRWALLIVTFILTVVYLPLSTMAVHVLVWSEDLWAVPNPYTNATSFPPIVASLGPADEYRDPLDFCWTTTMKKNEVNFAPVVVVLAAIVVLSLTIWFPIALRSVIKHSVPKIDRYTSLGRLRNSVDLDGEYHRLLNRDQNPFAFLYSGYRRGWGTYQSTYLFAKLSTLVIIAVINPDNCLFRSFSRSTIPIVRQVLLLISTIGFFLAQCILAPFLDPINNASEWTSRLNYVATATIALLVALDIPGQTIYNVYLLYIIYIITYGLSIYFTIINLGPVRRMVKRLARRIDFSIDIFSPRLDLSPLSPHTKRRIWQESITALLLTSPECRIPAKQRMVYAQARDSEFPPYLLNFCGTPAERHAENLKILREIGSLKYNKASALLSGPDYEWFRKLESQIQKHFIGPDCYWKSPSETKPELVGCANFFGNAWWIPFPPTLVLRYDSGTYAVLQEVADLEAYISQNSSHSIRRRRHIRLSLRALDGQVVKWPYEHIAPIGSQSPLSWGRRRYTTQSSVHYNHCVLRIEHRGHLSWQGLQLGSGFDIRLTYSKKLDLDGSVIGLDDDFDLTSPLARFFMLNNQLVSSRLAYIESTLVSYRRHHRQECHRKSEALTYRFLSHVYDHPREPSGLTASSLELEKDPRVRVLMSGSEEVFSAAYTRFSAVSINETRTWWYIFWDDLWRRNHDTISGLELHAVDFNPYYPTSIAYTPLPRAALETFLTQRGLLSKSPRWGDFFHPGFLNKLYLRLNETVFRGSSRAILFHIGQDHSELDMEDVDLDTLVQPSTLGTGGGTDHDNSSIRARPAYRWEGLLSDPVLKGSRGKRNFLAKLGAWMGVTPLWRSGVPSPGLSLDVRMENGRYVLLDDGSSFGGSHVNRTKLDNDND